MHRLLAPLVGLLCCCVLQLTLQQNQERVFAAVKDLTETVANLSLPAEDGVVVDQTWADNKVRSLVTCPVVTMHDCLQSVYLIVLRHFFKDTIVTNPTALVRQPVSFITLWCAPLLVVAFIQWEPYDVFVVVAVLVMALGIRRGYTFMRA